MAKKPIGKVVLVIVMGAMIGSLLGQVLGLVLPEGVVRDFFLRSAELNVGPTPISVGFLGLTLGFSFTLNIIGLLGIAIAAYILRWYL
ncbi:DUF4321 domain-containing protein [candidate division KSB1 bacterium]|nr:DUF4321 domain-containing protein [candidate division KSB1 bacterium]TDI87160.1 MAG: DUF4321 domain-containing protein [Caldithrix sp.]